MRDLLLAQQLLAACGGYVEAKAAAIELNNQADLIESQQAEIEELASDLDKCRKGSAIRTRINDKQVRIIKNIRAALEEG